MIPLYQEPEVSSDGLTCTGADYVTIATSSVASRTIVILNPDDGPVTSSTAEMDAYLTCITYL